MHKLLQIAKDFYYLTDYTRSTRLVRVFTIEDDKLIEVTDDIAALTKLKIKERKYTQGIALYGFGYSPAWRMHTIICAALGKDTKDIGYNKLI